MRLDDPLMGLALAGLAGLGVLVATGSTARRPSLRARAAGVHSVLRLRLRQAGLDDVTPGQFCVASLLAGAAAGVAASLLFGPGVPAAAVAAAGSAAPLLLWRHRRARRRAVAGEAWPRLIEELRVMTGAMGRSIPQSLVELGASSPEELRPAFVAGQREWALTTDMGRTIEVMKAHLEDPTFDVLAETLLVAAEVGGDLDQRLADLAEDRRRDLSERKEAEARQSGARFARAFVVLVPAGMAVAGLTVGDGRDAYRAPQGQALVLLGLVVLGACWIWATQLMRLPRARRVFDR